MWKAAWLSDSARSGRDSSRETAMAIARHLNCGTPGCKGCDALKWQRMPLQARMTVNNMRTKEPLHVNALAFDVSRDVAIVFLKV